VAIPGKSPGLCSAGLLGVSTARRMWPKLKQAGAKQDHRMEQSGLTDQLTNFPLSISNNVATELTWASVALGHPGRG
jgi:hypothetical protein